MQRIGQHRSAFGLAALVAAIGVSLVTGCGTPRKVEPEPQQVTIRNERNQRAVYWLQPGTGRESARQVGYVTDCFIRIGETESLAVYVHDKKHVRVGYYFTDGATWKFDSRGVPKQIGNFEANRSLEEIYGLQGTFDLRPVGATRERAATP
ncbi:MAG: hypothetical protein ACKVX7_12540 [Planctomycetota bacterium]